MAEMHCDGLASMGIPLLFMVGFTTPVPHVKPKKLKSLSGVWWLALIVWKKIL